MTLNTTSCENVQSALNYSAQFVLYSPVYWDSRLNWIAACDKSLPYRLSNLRVWMVDDQALNRDETRISHALFFVVINRTTKTMKEK